MAKGKPGVVIYFETAKAIKGLDYETKGRLFEAIMDYAEDGVVPSFDGVLAAVWPFVADKIERDSERYDNVVIQRKRAIHARWWKRHAEENGLDPDDWIAKKKWIDEQMAADTDVYGSNTKNTVVSSVLQNVPTETEPKAKAKAKAKARDGNGNESASAPPPPKATKHKHGEYSNVLLTDEELNKLKAEYPGDWEARINNLSEYIASTGKAYKSHYATIRSWARKDKEEARKPRYGFPPNPCDSITAEDHEKDSINPW